MAYEESTTRTAEQQALWSTLSNQAVAKTVKVYGAKPAATAPEVQELTIFDQGADYISEFENLGESSAA